jgi:DNA helicase-2/ATP-dependent DNA helicase PcrA
VEAHKRDRKNNKNGKRAMKEAKVARLIGGAGTGKTTELLEVMKSVLEKIGDKPELIGFASFTKAAREEMVSRASSAFDCHPSVLDKGGWFRTVHSTCHKMLKISGDQLLACDDKASKWVADKLRVQLSWRKVADSGYSACVGDDEAAASLNLWDVSRNRIEPLTVVHAEKSLAGLDVPPISTVRHFAKRYEDAKRVDGKVDFVDILGRFAGIRFWLDGPEVAEPEGELPDGVRAWIFDEAQDSSKLVDMVCRRLVTGPEVIWAYLAADPFQSIFGFGGADYRNFLSWNVEKERTMPQSWRCPKPVMELGERCLRRMNTGYFDRGIAPASHEGSVHREASLEHALAKVDGSRSTLVLARCKYTLAKISDILESRKVPHANIGEKSDTKALTAYNAYWRLQHGMGIGEQDWKAAIELTPQKATGQDIFLERGQKAAWKRGQYDGHIDFIAADEIGRLGGVTPVLEEMIKDGRWSRLLDGAGKWYLAAKKHGPESATSPNVRLSTIHGAKGMEADDVVLATETAGRIERERELSPQVHDEECRIEYVAVTRAKQRLFICDSDEPFSMEIPL